MKNTEFERVPDMEGYYISSNAPPSGKFVPIEEVQAMVEQAHQAGQAEAGVDPSFSNAQLYWDKVGL